MKLTRRTVFASLAALAGVASAGFAPQPSTMDPVSAQMEDDDMWAAVARNGSTAIFADGHYGLVPDFDRCTPMREDRALVDQAVSDGRLRVGERAGDGLPLVWTLTLKGRLYACEQALDDPVQALAFRRMSDAGRWAQTSHPLHPRVRDLLLRRAQAGDTFGAADRWVHLEYAGAIQQGLVVPVSVVQGERIVYTRFIPTHATLNHRANGCLDDRNVRVFLRPVGEALGMPAAHA